MAVNVQDMLIATINGVRGPVDPTQLALTILAELRRHDLVITDGAWLGRLRDELATTKANLEQTQRERDHGATQKTKLLAAARALLAEYDRITRG